MATGYSAQDWTELFVASAGASAALTGLLFVAVSVNIERILEFKGLPERALQTLLLLLSVVVASVICLIPGQSTTALGIELLVVGVCFGTAIGRLLFETVPGAREYERAAAHLWLVLPGTLPLLAECSAQSSGRRSTHGCCWWRSCDKSATSTVSAAPANPQQQVALPRLGQDR